MVKFSGHPKNVFFPPQNIDNFRQFETIHKALRIVYSNTAVCGGKLVC